jgi:hypothetical protein
MRKRGQIKQKRERTLAEAFAALRRIAEEEDYTLEIPPRQERPNPFPDALDELSRGTNVFSVTRNVPHFEDCEVLILNPFRNPLHEL